MKRALPVLLLAMLCVSTALATTYMRVEKDGTKTYSDRPIPGGEPIDLKPAQGYTAPPSSGYSSTLPREQQLLQEVDSFTYKSCGVIPENDTTFTNPEQVPIAVVATPMLRQFDTITLTVDGQVVGTPNASSYVMSPVNRGSHTVGVTIKNRYGKLLCSSTSSFHVMRPGVNSPANRPTVTPHR